MVLIEYLPRQVMGELLGVAAAFGVALVNFSAASWGWGIFATMSG